MSQKLRIITLSLVVLLGVGFRTFVASQGWFYWDDLILHARARDHDLPNPELLFQAHDGHLMPGAWFLEWLLASFAPLSWPAAVITLGVLQLLAAAAVARACFIFFPTLPWALVPLLLYLVTPLTLPTSTWLATAINILPLHAGLALMLAYSWRALGRDQREARRDLGIAALALCSALLFSERALFAGPAVVFTLLCFATASGILRESARRITRIAVVLGLPTLAWAMVYFFTIGDPRVDSSPMFAELLKSGYLFGLLSTPAGGPWAWERWHPSPPWAAPSAAALVAGGVVITGVLAWTSIGRVHRIIIWAPTFLYPLLPLLALVFARTGSETSPEITQTLRHFSEVAVLATLSLAFLLSLKHRQTQSHRTRNPWLPWSGAFLVVCFIASSAVSTVTYARVWAEQPAREYFSTLRTEMAGHEAPLLDQKVAFEVLAPVVHPDNQLSRLVDGVEGFPPIRPWTTDPVLIDAHGKPHPASLVSFRATEPGSTTGDEPGCGTRVGPDGVALSLDGPLVDRDWVVQFNYFAGNTGTLELSLDAELVKIPVEAGLTQVHVQLNGGGSQLQARPGEGLNELCVGQSHVGALAITQTQ